MIQDLHQRIESWNISILSFFGVLALQRAKLL
jgi:hypothetical protein